ncbi:MAG: DUF1345 domain-containing protein [Propionibacteriaceae bacterium]|nr:DUF1345 domain-containing protein [Propionibacteriaceae bacterium]
MTSDAPAPDRLTWRQRLHREGTRAWLSSLAALAAGVGLALVYPLYEWRTSQWTWLVILSGWAAMALLHLILTWVAFRGLEGQELVEAVSRSQRKERRGRWFRSVMALEGAGSFAVQMATLALVGVLMLLLVGELRSLPVLMAVGAALVTVCWFDVLVVYAVHYARLDVAGDQLVFPDAEAERAFSDYVYVSMGVQATYGLTDMAAATRSMRRTLTLHGLLAFLFNTVIIALIVSLALNVGA